tara:strand:+ start:192 stop:419 length:228 start_codon:yes stop_codon:yes gene_type:complete
MNDNKKSEIKDVVREYLLHDNPTFLTREQTMELLSIGKSTLRRYVEDKVFTEYRLGMRCYYNRTEILTTLINSVA